MGKKWLVTFYMTAMFLNAGCSQSGGPENSSLMTPSEPPASLSLLPPKPPGFADVTDHYGPLIVREGEFEAEAKIKPWSSWWFPLRDTYLFKGTTPGESPLEKYDRYVGRAHDEEGAAAQYEEEHLYEPNAASWEGLCNAWAASSVLAPEPSHPVTLQGVTFGVGDLKALLVKSFEIVTPLRQFGQRFNGDRRGVYDDIYPDQFHKILQAELFDKGRPFIMDKDPSVPIWNVPVWKAQLKVEKDASNPNLLHVSSWVFAASSFVDSYDYVGTLGVALEYTYDLFGIPQEDGVRVVAGSWTGGSVDYHPDFVTVLPESVEHHSLNQGLKLSYVDEILAEAYKSEAVLGLVGP